jgi:cell division initiation protein
MNRSERYTTSGKPPIIPLKMKLTALEIKQQQFEKALRGYDVGEVKAFLNVVSTEWEYMVARNRDMEREIQQLKDKLNHYERVEHALHDTLQSARETAEQRLTNAKKEARNRIEKAEMEAEGIISRARQQRRDIRQNILTLLSRREEIIRGMNSYLDLAQESLTTFARDEAGVFALGKEEDEAPSVGSGTSSSQVTENKTTSSDDMSDPFMFSDSDDIDDLLDKID